MLQRISCSMITGLDSQIMKLWAITNEVDVTCCKYKKGFSTIFDCWSDHSDQWLTCCNCNMTGSRWSEASADFLLARIFDRSTAGLKAPSAIKMPKIDTLYALDDEMTSIFNTLWTHSEHTLNTLWTHSEDTLMTLWRHSEAVSYTHLTLPTIYSV